MQTRASTEAPSSWPIVTIVSAAKCCPQCSSKRLDTAHARRLVRHEEASSRSGRSTLRQLHMHLDRYTARIITIDRDRRCDRFGMVVVQVARSCAALAFASVGSRGL